MVEGGGWRVGEGGGWGRVEGGGWRVVEGGGFHQLLLTLTLHAVKLRLLYMGTKRLFTVNWCCAYYIMYNSVTESIIGSRRYSLTL